MSNNSLVPYPVSKAFLQRLQAHGLSLDDTAIRPARNLEAEQVLPSGRRSSGSSSFSSASSSSLLSRLGSVFLVVSLLSLLMLPGSVLADSSWKSAVSSWVVSDDTGFLIMFRQIWLLLGVMVALLVLWKQTLAMKGVKAETSLVLEDVEARRRKAADERKNEEKKAEEDKEERGEQQVVAEKVRQAELEKAQALSLAEQADNGCLRLVLGGATRTGLVRSENQDAFALQSLGVYRGLMVVCDGVGGHPGGARAAQHASSFLSASLSVRMGSGVVDVGMLREALCSAQRSFVLNGIGGLTTALVAVVDGAWLHYAALGDGALSLVHPDGMVQGLLAPHHALDAPDNVITAYLSASESFEPRLGSVRWQPGSLLLAMSDGASDLLPIDQLAASRHDYLHYLDQGDPHAVCDHLLHGLEVARDAASGALLHSDNMTLAMAALLSVDEGGDGDTDIGVEVEDVVDLDAGIEGKCVASVVSEGAVSADNDDLYLSSEQAVAQSQGGA